MKRNFFIITSIILVLALSASIFSLRRISIRKDNLEKVIILNEFSQLAKSWRNFNSFLKELVIEGSEANAVISSQQLKPMWELGWPAESVIMDSKHFFIKSEYRDFISRFDIEFNALYERFFRKLPVMSVEELESIQLSMEDAYTRFITSGNWIMYQDGNTEISFDKKVLDEVLGVIINIKSQLE